MTETNPFRKNMRVELTIDGMTSEGQGVGHLDGVAFFVPETCIGEKVAAHIIKVEKRYCVAKVVEILAASPNRVQPRCPVYSLCGGCTMQHMTYDEQLRLKRQFVQDAFERIGGISDIQVKPVIGMENPWRYRNKGSFPFGKENGCTVFGFYATRSHRLIPFTDCPIQNENVIKTANAVAEWANECGLSVYDEKTGYGTLRACVSRITSENRIMTVVVTHGKLPEEKKLIEKLEFVDSLYHNRNDNKTNVITGDSFRPLKGEAALPETIDGVGYLVSPQSFLQVNSLQTAVLYQTAIKYLSVKPNETVFDLYCGIGTISLQIAKEADRVVGIECVPEAIEDAKENAKRNGIENVEFICGLAEKIMPELVAKGYHTDAICLDPPRKGCEQKVLEAIIDSKVNRIVYVSCNPATLARDVKILSENGYSVESVQPVDMFPNTSHVECVCFLSNNNARTKDYIEIGMDTEDYKNDKR